MEYEELYSKDPYTVGRDEKRTLLTERLAHLSRLHSDNCPYYRNLIRGLRKDLSKCGLEDFPYYPVRLFKEYDLKSVDDDKVVKTLTSSGTTGQRVSKIYLDRTTAVNQQKTLVKIVSNYIGSSRAPMIIIDCPSVIKDRDKFSARGAGILGFSIFATKKIYALNDDMKLNVDELVAFLDETMGKTIFMFGFTFMIWQYFYKELCRLKDEGITIDLSDAVLFHGGGWKKLINEAVDRSTFKKSLKEVCGLRSVHDYYGMVEQTGCIYVECEEGHFHASTYSDVLVRDPSDWSVCPNGKEGIVQVLSGIPESYPGHSLLTEDRGIVFGEDDCPCGRKGKYFDILGRVKEAEIRGCSDTFAKNVSDVDAVASMEFIVGSKDILDNMPKMHPKRPFDDSIVDYLDNLSKIIMNSKEAKMYPDLITLSFWMRKSSVVSMAKRYDGNDMMGRGTVFHIAPSNVPLNYAYSMVTGLLFGNANIVRMPTKRFPQAELLNRLIIESLEACPQMSDYICIVRYERNKDITDHLSAMADSRIIWGGDNTIMDIKRSPLPPRATEIAFSDRFSLAVIDSDTYLDSEDKDGISRRFYNDTYIVDQNACSSPILIVWTGARKDEAKRAFWHNVHDYISGRFAIQPIRAIDKMTLSTMFLMDSEGSESVESSDNLITRINVSEIAPRIVDLKGNSGLFYEYDCDDLNDLIPLLNDTRCQTVTTLCDAEPIASVLDNGVKGVDRVVPMGDSMAFDLVWDGYDMSSYLARRLNVVRRP